MYSKKKSKSGRFSKSASKILSFIQKILAKIQGILFSNYDMRYINLYYRKFNRDDHFYSFSKSISEYAIINSDKIEELKENLDQQSLELVDTLLERYHYIYTHNVLELNKILTIKELEEIGKIIKFKNEYKKFKKPILNHLDNAVFFYKHGLIYVPKEIINKLKKKDIIDGGAYIGDSAFMFEKDYEINKIHSFEPINKNYNRLLKSIERNNLKKVIPIRSALGIENSIIKIKDSSAASSLFKNGEEEIKVTTIDDYVSKNSLLIGIIKLDIEGYGLRAIKGAKKTIIEQEPILLLSIYHNSEEFFELKSYIKNLNLDYKFIIRKLGASKSFYDTNLIAWVE